MKKSVIFLILLGTLCLSFRIITRHFFETPADLVHFIRGFGVGIIIAALLLQKKLEKKSQT